jgi:WD40 repeat protein
MTQVLMNTVTQTTATENPFIGLRNYNESDKENFCGRDKEVKEVLRKLKTTRFLSIVGAAGSGKSSLIQAGILPELMSGFEGQGGTKWGIAMFSPGRDPIGNLANALARRNVLSPDIKAEPNSNRLEETLRRSSLGLVNCVKEQGETLKGKNVIIVINQFEELFDLMNDDNMRNEARDFVKLLLRAVNENDKAIYVLISIESDALSEITKFRGLPELVNQGQYLMPRMTKQDLRQVILSPLERQNIRIDEMLRGAILDNVENTDDQLPVLQHALMRTVENWERARDESIANNLEIEGIEGRHYNEIGAFSDDFLVEYEKEMMLYGVDIPEQTGLNILQIREQLLKKFAKREDTELYVQKLLDLYKTGLEIEYYQDLKPMQKALGIHAEEVFWELNLEQKKACERIFKAITDGSKGVDNVKTQPVTISTLVGITELRDVDEVKDILEALIKNERNFIQISNEDMRGSTTVTLMHGSLARKWNRLKNWLEAETESAKTYIRLANDAVIHEMDEKKQGLWRDNQLDFGEEWRNWTEPNFAWAMRYHASYDTAMRFLDDSIAQRDAELAAKLKAEEDDKRRKRLILWIVSIAAVICLFFAAWAYKKSQEAKESEKIAYRKEGEAKLSEYEAQNEKVKAAMSAKEASRQAAIAETKAKEAEVSQGIAVKKAEEARKAAIAARAAAKKAAEEEEKAIANGKIAKEEGIKARAAEADAIKKEKIAKIAEAEAQKLKLQKLAEAIAIKSIAIENKPIVQAQVAKKAMEIFQASEDLTAGEIDNSEIYNALYFGVKGLKPIKAFNEFVGDDKHRGTVHQIVNQGQSIYSAGSDGNIVKWTINKSNAVDKPTVTTAIMGNVSETILSMDVKGGKLVTGGKDRKVNVFDTNTGNKLESLDLHGDRFVWSVVFIGMNKIVSSGQDKSIVLTDLATKKTQTLLQTKANAKKLAVHINNAMIIAGDDVGVLSLIDVNEIGRAMKTRSLAGGEITALKFSPNGKYLAVGNVKGKLYLLNFPSLTVIKDFDTHTFDITDIQFNSNSTFITTSRDRTAKYWDIQEMDDISYEPLTFNDHSDWCTAAAFVGNQAMVGCKDGSVKFWALDVATLSNELCGLLKEKKMDDKDWLKYIGNDTQLIDKVGKSVCD